MIGELRSMAASALYASHQLIAAEPKTHRQVPNDEGRTLAAWSNSAILRALQTDLNVGLTLATIASQAQDEAKRRRNRRNARIAHETVMRKAQKLSLSEADSASLETQLAALRSALESLGETF